MRTPGDARKLLGRYVEEMHRCSVSRSLLERAQRVLPRLFTHLRSQGVRDFRSAGEVHLVAFARHQATLPTREEGTLSTATQRAYLDAVRGFFAWLCKRGVILENPALDLSSPKVLRLPRRVLSEAEARRLMNAPSPWTVFGIRDRAILETLYGTGIRRGECVRLDVNDIDLGQGLLVVRSGKGKKDRLVPIAGRAALALDRYLRDSRLELVKDSRETALFLSKYGRRPSPDRINVLVRKYALTASLRNLFPHALRHSFATHLLKGKASIRHVQELLGHKSLHSTAVYTHVAVQDLREVLGRCHPRERAFGRRRRA